MRRRRSVCYDPCARSARSLPHRSTSFPKGQQATEDKVHDLSKYVHNLTQSVYNTDYNTCLSNIRTDVDRLQVRMRDVEKLVADLHFSLGKNMAQMDQAREHMEQFVARVERRMEQATASMAQVASRTGAGENTAQPSQ